MIQRPKYGRKDIPLAETPAPTPITVHTVKLAPIPKNVASGVVISKKDEAAHAEDFKFLKKK